MRQLRGHLGLTQKPRLDLGPIRELRWQQLHGHGPFQPSVTRTIHDAHAAATEFALYLILWGEGTLDSRQQFGVGGRIYRIRHVGPAKRDRITINVG